MAQDNQNLGALADKQRWRLLKQLESVLETPMVVLGFIWLGLMIIDLVRGETRLTATAGRFIWIIFIVDFLIRFSLAPRKLIFLQRNIISAVALALPALRTLRALRALRLLRATRGLTFVRVISSTNRGMKALRRSMNRRGASYVLLLTVLVLFAGASGMYAFERGSDGFSSYAEALWWTAMLLTSLGSASWPVTPEGRLLCFLLGLYGFAVFGYLTATLASFFVDRDANDVRGAVAGETSIKSLQEEVRLLREVLQEKQ